MRAAALPYEKPFPFGTILVPPVRLQGKALYFRPRGPLQPATGRPDRLGSTSPGSPLPPNEHSWNSRGSGEC